MTKTPGQLYREQARAALAEQWKAEFDADAERGGQMPEPEIDLEAVAQAKAAAEAEIAKQAALASQEQDAVKKAEAEQVKADAESWERIASGETTEEDQAKLEAMQAAYEEDLAAKREVLERGL